MYQVFFKHIINYLYGDIEKDESKHHDHENGNFAITGFPLYKSALTYYCYMHGI